MEVIDQSHEILKLSDNPLQDIEYSGRTCYQSFDAITDDSSIKFCENLIKRGHGAMIEFGDMTVKFITNRGVTHEIVRHRIASYAQESTRYVRYDKEDMQFIRPVWGNWDVENLNEINVVTSPEWRWLDAMEQAEVNYKFLMENGWIAQQAREVLPNSLKTEICMKTNFRSWINFFILRTSKAAHPQMRALATGLLKEVVTKVPVIFDGILERNLNSKY